MKYKLQPPLNFKAINVVAIDLPSDHGTFALKDYQQNEYKPIFKSWIYARKCI